MGKSITIYTLRFFLIRKGKQHQLRCYLDQMELSLNEESIFSGGIMNRAVILYVCEDTSPNLYDLFLQSWEESPS